MQRRSESYQSFRTGHPILLDGSADNEASVWYEGTVANATNSDDEDKIEIDSASFPSQLRGAFSEAVPIVNDTVPRSQQIATSQRASADNLLQQPLFVGSTMPTFAVAAQEYQLVPTPPRALRADIRRVGLDVAFPKSSADPASSTILQAAPVNPVLRPLDMNSLTLHTASRQHPARPDQTGASSSSTTGSRGRKKSWWIKCFLQTYNENGEKCFVCLACKTHQSGKTSASRLTQHLWQCPRVTKDVKKRLLSDSAHIRSNVKRYSNGIPGIQRQVYGDNMVPRKRLRQLTNVVTNPNVCTEKEFDELSMLFVRTVVEFCLPFTLFDSTRSSPNSFRKIFRRTYPGYEEKFPSRHLMVERYLTRLHDQTLTVVKSSIQCMLAAGFGTVIFDGWDDITMSSVVNVLLRIESKSCRKTFFLDSVYTRHTRMGADEYVRIVERVMEGFGGLVRICGVASDGAKACVKARNALSWKVDRNSRPSPRCGPAHEGHWQVNFRQGSHR